MSPINFQRLDRPLSFRVSHEAHAKYKSLSGIGRKTIQYKFNIWLNKQLRDLK